MSGTVYVVTAHQRDIHQAIVKGNVPNQTESMVHFWPVNKAQASPAFSLLLQYTLDSTSPSALTPSSREGQPRPRVFSPLAPANQ